MLTQGEITTYERDGLVIPAGFRIAPQRLEQLRDRVTAVVEANPDIDSDRLINVHHLGAALFGVRGDEVFFEHARLDRDAHLDGTRKQSSRRQ